MEQLSRYVFTHLCELKHRSVHLPSCHLPSCPPSSASSVCSTYIVVIFIIVISAVNVLMSCTTSCQKEHLRISVNLLRYCLVCCHFFNFVFFVLYLFAPHPPPSRSPRLPAPHRLIQVDHKIKQGSGMSAVH